MELVKRYIAAVQRELPKEKQQEIGRELNANIMDQIDALTEQQGQLSDAQLSALLIDMGHPSQVARQFVPLQPLINTDLMPMYKNTLFMVLGILFLLQTVKTTAAWLSSVDMGLISYLHGLASGFIEPLSRWLLFLCLLAAPMKAVIVIKTGDQSNYPRPNLVGSILP
jgi:hypothetical protein